MSNSKTQCLKVDAVSVLRQHVDQCWATCGSCWGYMWVNAWTKFGSVLGLSVGQCWGYMWVNDGARCGSMLGLSLDQCWG